MSMVMTTSMAVYSPCLCLHDVHTPARNLVHCSNGATTAFSSVFICNSRIFFSDKKNITCIRSLARTEPRGPNFCRNSWNSSNLQAAAEGGLILECDEDDGELSLCEDSHSEKLYSEIQPSTTTCGCKVCRRKFFGTFGALLSLTSPAMADSSAGIMSNAQKVMEEVHPPRPGWYEEFYAISLDHGMKSYEVEIAGWKMQLLNQLKGEAERVLELGIGTGTNLKYYAGGANVSVVGVDPNKHMEKYAQAAATAAGLAKSQFKFIQGVGEALPILDSSMDAVVCTLVLCSVKDVAMTLKEVERVLKPGGRFIFVEHVAAPDGTPLRFWQNVLDPLQQFVSDGCHLTRETGKHIEEHGFSDVSINTVSVSNVSLISPHVYGTAYK